MTDMSALYALKTSRKPLPSKKNIQHGAKESLLKPGKVSNIATYFEREREENKRMFRESVTDNSTNQCQILCSKTAVYAAHHPQQFN